MSDNVKSFITPEKHLENLRKDYESEYLKLNKGALAVMKTEDLVKLQSTHFQSATAKINDANMLFKHVSLISSILAERRARGET